MKHKNVTERIIAAFYRVYNVLGWGFLVKVYQGAMGNQIAQAGVER